MQPGQQTRSDAHNLQVVDARETITAQIERAGLEFRETGECDRWFQGSDPKVRKASNACHLTLAVGAANAR